MNSLGLAAYVLIATISSADNTQVLQKGAYLYPDADSCLNDMLEGDANLMKRDPTGALKRVVVFECIKVAYTPFLEVFPAP